MSGNPSKGALLWACQCPKVLELCSPAIEKSNDTPKCAEYFARPGSYLHSDEVQEPTDQDG